MAESKSPVGFVNVDELKSALLGSGGLSLLAAGGIALLSSVATHADTIFTNSTIAGFATFGISFAVAAFKKAFQGPVK